MARTPKPWFREDRQAYFVTVNGTRHNLGPDKKEAFRRFHELMAAPDEHPQPIPQPIGPGSLTVGQVFEKFLDWCQQHRSARTYEWTRDHIQRFCDHPGGVPAGGGDTPEGRPQGEPYTWWRRRDEYDRVPGCGCS